MTQRRQENDYLVINPFTLPADQQGWRGLSDPTLGKRKWWTILENDICLVTGLVVLPGERGPRHSHETGELSISYHGDNKPLVRWNPPGLPHGGLLPEEPAALDDHGRAEVAQAAGNTLLATLLERILQEQLELRSLLTRPQPGLRIAVEVLFPPFKTTIDDPRFPDKQVIIGQWHD